MTTTNKLSYLLIYTFPFVIFCGYFSGNSSMPLILALSWVLAAVFLDLIGKQEVHYSIQDVHDTDNSGKFEWNFMDAILYFYLVIHLVLLFTGLYYVSFKPFAIGWLLAALPVGFSGAIALNISHEIMHTSVYFERILSRISSAFQFWGVHEFEHLYLHHRFEIICTEEDTSYAPIGMSIYHYAIQNLYHNYTHAWLIQKEILEKKGYPTFSRHNIVLISISASILIGILILIFLGPYAFLFYLLQAFISSSIFSLMTYYQHYGLTRRKNADGSYEDLTYMNMWNSDSYFSNRFLFNLPRHAHHHIYQFCRYYHLKYIENSPRLPYGYLVLVPIALIPPIWYRLMNERAKKILLQRDELERKGLL